jgi:hypothetical protein
MTGAWGWVLRSVLFVVAVVAPAVGYAVRLGQSENGKIALDGLGWGLIGTIVALALFTVSVRTTMRGRLSWLAAATVALLAVWGGVLGIVAL